MTDGEIVAVVLAGGRSRRYGSPKTLARWQGRPLIEQPIAALAAVFGRVAVVAKPETPLPTLPDAVETWSDTGAEHHPACGLLAAFEHAPGSRIAVLACDAIGTDPADLRRLAAARPAGGVSLRDVTAVGVTPEGTEPLVGVWSPAARDALSSAVGARRSMREAARRAGALEVDLAVVPSNLNRPSVEA